MVWGWPRLGWEGLKMATVGLEGFGDSQWGLGTATVRLGEGWGHPWSGLGTAAISLGDLREATIKLREFGDNRDQV